MRLSRPAISLIKPRMAPRRRMSTACFTTHGYIRGQPKRYLTKAFAEVSGEAHLRRILKTNAAHYNQFAPICG